MHELSCSFLFAVRVLDALVDFSRHVSYISFVCVHTLLYQYIYMKDSVWYAIVLRYRKCSKNLAKLAKKGYIIYIGVELVILLVRLVVS